MNRKYTKQDKNTIGYCVKCHKKTQMAEPEVKRTKRGRLAMVGHCITCDTKMFRFLPKNFKD